MNVKNTKKSSIQPAVKIDSQLYLELKKWLKTKEAKKLGFHSMAHFITCSARELMWKYREDKLNKNG